MFGLAERCLLPSSGPTIFKSDRGPGASNWAVVAPGRASAGASETTKKDKADHQTHCADASRPDGRHAIGIAGWLTDLGCNYFNEQCYEQAEELLGYAIELRERLQNHMHPDLTRPLASMGAVLAIAGRHREAEITLLRALVIVGKTEKVADHRVILHNLVYVYEQQKRGEDALRIYNPCLAASILGSRASTIVSGGRNWEGGVFEASKRLFKS